MGRRLTPTVVLILSQTARDGHEITRFTHHTSRDRHRSLTLVMSSLPPPISGEHC